MEGKGEWMGRLTFENTNNYKQSNVKTVSIVLMIPLLLKTVLALPLSLRTQTFQRYLSFYTNEAKNILLPHYMNEVL